ncbi:MAG TPA: uracil-DNA glycosylase [candidate division Zixibacteria bacterium]|nr:uracil-DNA glycosylase [candidate division Zixibacteria bacterium]
MSRTFDAATRQAVAERVRFYRELGIYDLYRRPVDESAEEVEAPIRAAEFAAAADSGGPGIAALVEAVPQPSLVTPITDRAGALRVIREDLGDCTRCPLHQQGRKQIVFGVGNPQAELMFVGEGPGADEDEQGEPFVGRAGQLLTNMITNGMGLRREDVYIANVVKCRPPQNRTPLPEECAICSPFLMRQIAVVRPKAIVALGAVAAKTLLGVNDTMANLRGRMYEFSPIVPRTAPEYDPGYSAQLAVTYHPAYLLRDPRQKKETWKDLQMVMRFLGLPIPTKSADGQ